MIAAILETLSEMFSHDFIRQAFLAGTLVAIAAGLVGYFVVLRNQVFAGDALSHVAFTGSLAALALGIEPTVGLLAATILIAMVIGAMPGRAQSRDVVIGTVFAWVLGLGSLFLSLYTTSASAGNGAVGVNVLFGSIYGIGPRQALVTAALSAVAIVLLLALARPLLFASLDADVASARGLPVGGLGIAFMAVLGLTVGVAVQAVGALLIIGLLVTPAAAAHRLTARPYLALAIAPAISLSALWLGLTVAFLWPQLPPSFTIVAVAFALYLGVLGGGAVRQRRHGRDRRTTVSAGAA